MSADGVIVAPLGESSAVNALERLSANLPFVFVDSRLPEALPGIDFIGTDNKQSVGLITNYLCRTGTPPKFLGMPRVNSNSVEREGAYRQEMDRLGHAAEVIKSDVAGHGWEFEAYAHDVMDQHFGRGNHCDATVLCANDRLAIGAIRAANRHGLLYRDATGPRRLRIAGHDDHPLSRYMTPALTTVAQDAIAIGQSAVRLLIQRVREETQSGSGAVEERYPATLKVRESA
jgi:DNA-binding LacI/PurR family transcriptional regulator